MLGRAAPTPLPEHGLDDVRRVGPAPRPPRPGPLRRAHVGHDAWVLRLQLATVAASTTSVYPGVPSRWHRFDPSLGLQRLRDLIASVSRDEGIELADDVGVSSHAGDLLRRAAIPARLAGPDTGRDAGI
jgi:hypothetical protein